ncbi:hypothetical protein GCM10008967_13450 [Bacillus carboniphilus]|uniref:Uncharacterized protein n=1 Tax=Bacillus carboniphilus TaxID=86663 RepID=A0ABN0W3V8_9BACI
MLSFRGDAHKFYEKLKKSKRKDPNFTSNRELSEIREIQSFYLDIETVVLQDIYYKMIKEKSGTGIIPIFVSAGPWLLFIFSKQLQSILFKNGSYLWLLFVLAYLITLVFSVILHFHEKAWAALHIGIIQDILKDRKEKKEKG